MTDSGNSSKWARHFGQLAGAYDHEAFRAGRGLQHLSEIEVETVTRRLGNGVNGPVLDAGVGTGRFSSVLENAGTTVVGMDFSHEMLKQCRATVPDARLIVGQVGKALPFDDSVLGAVICIRVMKYVDDWLTAFDEFWRVLKPEAPLIVQFSNLRSAARWGYGSLPIHHESLAATTKTIERCGFSVKAIDPGTRAPYPLYKWARSERRLNWINAGETGIRILLGGRSWLARNFIITCQKVDA